MMFETLEGWHWVAAGLVISALEILIPGNILLWLGISGITTGIVKWIIPGMGVEVQLIIFAVLSVLSIVATLTWFRRRPIESDKPDLNLRGQQLVGRVMTLDEPMANGMGRARVGDTTWRIAGEDFNKGTQVKVVDVRGTTLIVEKA
jgi:membrane protein implicated in regulation of membrane protease activity